MGSWPAGTAPVSAAGWRVEGWLCGQAPSASPPSPRCSLPAVAAARRWVSGPLRWLSGLLVMVRRLPIVCRQWRPLRLQLRRHRQLRRHLEKRRRLQLRRRWRCWSGWPGRPQQRRRPQRRRRPPASNPSFDTSRTSWCLHSWMRRKSVSAAASSLGELIEAKGDLVPTVFESLALDAPAKGAPPTRRALRVGARFLEWGGWRGGE